MTSRLRTSNLEQDSNFDEGVGELSVEEKYGEVKQLIALGKEKGFLLYDEIYEVLPEEITSLPEELDEIYIRFNDLGIDVVEDADKQNLAPTTGKTMVTIDGTIEEKEMDQREEVQADIVAAASGIVDKTNDPVRMSTARAFKARSYCFRTWPRPRCFTAPLTSLTSAPDSRTTMY